LLAKEPPVIAKSSKKMAPSFAFENDSDKNASYEMEDEEAIGIKESNLASQNDRFSLGAFIEKTIKEDVFMQDQEDEELLVGIFKIDSEEYKNALNDPNITMATEDNCKGEIKILGYYE
jgi:hypothetical protein